jgi:predicted phosphate transport protein (TIGR00153 family)
VGHRLSLKEEYGFFELFERHATLVVEGAKVLAEVADRWPAGKEACSRIEEVEHECDSVAHMTIDLLHQSFITPLDRDEILRLISRLDDVADLTESASRRMCIYELGPLPDELKGMTKVLHRSMQKVLELVRLLRGIKHVDRLRELCQEINRLENEGDTLMHLALAKIFKTYAAEPLTVIKLKEVYETVEMAVDRCEDVANVVEGIVLEHG